MKYEVRIAGEKLDVEVERDGSETIVRGGDREETVDLARVGQSPVYSLIVGNRSYELSVHRKDGGYEIRLAGESYVARVLDERAARIAAASGGATDEEAGEIVCAPMPGIVVGVSVKPGSVVEPGQGVVTLEAMKMENELRSTTGGVVKEVRVEVGQGVTQGEPLVVIE